MNPTTLMKQLLATQCQCGSSNLRLEYENAVREINCAQCNTVRGTYEGAL